MITSKRGGIVYMKHQEHKKIELNLMNPRNGFPDQEKIKVLQEEQMVINEEMSHAFKKMWALYNFNLSYFRF